MCWRAADWRGLRGGFRGGAALLVIAGVVAALSAQERPRHGRLFPPQDLGVLEGPDRDAWQMPGEIMDALGIGDGSVVADLGAGGGWFTVRLARRVGPNGLVYAEDVQRQMVDAIDRRVAREGLRNVVTVLGEDDDPRLPPEALDAVLMVDAYHEVQNRVQLLANVRASLKPNGRLGIVDFRREGGGPGPAMEERVDPATVVADADVAGLRLLAHERFLPYQYLLVFGR
ncbi:MAG: methyltransferase domain-containing protein [Acidobacteria bacterium]|nr:methyltransferase domain-containing protein [Acidobacteriota bacterium]